MCAPFGEECGSFSLSFLLSDLAVFSSPFCHGRAERRKTLFSIFGTAGRMNPDDSFLFFSFYRMPRNDWRFFSFFSFFFPLKELRLRV